MNLNSQETDPEKKKQHGEYIFVCDLVLKRYARVAQNEEEERVRIEKAKARLEARMAKKEEEERVRIEEAKARLDPRMALERPEQAQCTIC